MRLNGAAAGWAVALAAVFTAAQSFAFRADGHFAVVSSARMDPANWGERGDALRLRTRLRKMLSKNLGIMVYDLPQSRDRRSVLYGPILSLADLDSIGEDF